MIITLNFLAKISKIKLRLIKAAIQIYKQVNMVFLSYEEQGVRIYSLKRKYGRILKKIEGAVLNRTLNATRSEKPFIIAFTGASSCGKTYLAKLLTEMISKNVSATYFSQDNYYRNFKDDFSAKYTLKEFYQNINFDDPIHMKFDKLHDDLNIMKKSQIGTNILIPKITFGTDTEFPTIEEQSTQLPIGTIIVTEGVFSFLNRDVYNLYDLRIFIDMNHDVRKSIWTDRNLKEGRFFNEHMWETTVNCFDSCISPYESSADIVLSNNYLSSDFENLFKEVFGLTNLA